MAREELLIQNGAPHILAFLSRPGLIDIFLDAGLAGEEPQKSSSNPVVLPLMGKGLGRSLQKPEFDDVENSVRRVDECITSHTHTDTRFHVYINV